MAARIGDDVDQTKKLKGNKAPAIEQLQTGGAGGASGNAGLGALNYDTSNVPVNKSGVAIPIVSPSQPKSPLEPQMETVSNRGMTTTQPIAPNLTATRGTNPGLTQVDKPVLASNISPVTPIVPMEAPKPLGTLGSLPAQPTTPAQSPLTISSSGDTKTLRLGESTISSSSPNMNRFTPEVMASLNQRIGADTAPGAQERRAEQVQIVADREQKGKEINQYWNRQDDLKTLRANQITAMRMGDPDRAAKFGEILAEENKNEASARSAQSASQVEAQKLGYTMGKDQRQFDYNSEKDTRDFGATQTNKRNDQSIEMQKANANINKNINEAYYNPANMMGSKSHSESYEWLKSQGGNSSEHLSKFVGPETAESIHKDPDPVRTRDKLRAKGLADNQIKEILESMNQ